MTIDISKIRVGDMVTLPQLRVSSELQRAFGGYVITVDLPCGDKIDLTSEDIATHTQQPREFQVGDRVKHPNFSNEVTIIHIHDGGAWISGRSGQQLANLSDLTLVEGGE